MFIRIKELLDKCAEIRFFVRSFNAYLSLLQASLVLCLLTSVCAYGQEALEEPVADRSEQEKATLKNENGSYSIDYEELRKAQRYLEENVRELETLYGAYHSSISQNQFNLGRIYMVRDQYDKALNAFRRSFEVHRINFGLHNVEQFPIVDQLIQANRALAKWTEVDSSYEYLYWLHRRAYGANSPEVLPILSRLFNWKVEAIDNRLFGDPEILIKQARKISRTARNILKQHPEWEQKLQGVEISEDATD